ncbi:ABC transporter ATP-binding protein [Salipaludibacillus sp. LMS25]|jgi:peptide/nickel transport system ATP-binding protein|uniref:ABC transporter ATP-binding protein n=1 Tax=Salipaludibacillus sp. LMS25 TaxID=2924031 RepID=UPI0020D1147F|nr:ABC transporter ATP-binding protein [Salipaludibacillus sp. LMS25]UTR13554.1 ABC transporter ATP-binding protein [Salipaludibacillus sp. LMS25]
MILSLNDVTIRSQNKTIVDQASVSIREGDWYALVGQSGSGKSLLSQSIGQILPSHLHVEGSAFFKQQNLFTLSAKEMRRVRGKKISYIFQDYQGSFTPFRKIGQHFDEYLHVHGFTSKKGRYAQAIEALNAVGLDDILYDRYPFQLSGGQLQRVAIALALLLSPELVIADEITTALDSVSGHRVLQMLAKRQKETGCSILFITHDWRHVRRYANRLAIMKEGKIVESGGKHRILDHPQHEYTKQLIKAAPILSKGLRSGLDKEKEG